MDDIDPASTERYVNVASVGDPAAARVCAALLESSGIPVRLHGEALGPYALTVGDMAVTALWVPQSMVEDAVAVITAAEIDHALVTDPEEGIQDPWTLPMRLLAALMAALLGWTVVRALLRVF